MVRATGLTLSEIDELADRYLRSERTIITWAMGITQHTKAVDTIKEIINLLLLRGNIGKPGAGASPIRGHSNVQGDRTMGIWEQMPDTFLDALQHEFHFDPPREHGVDALKGIQAMQRGDVKFWMGMGGNLVAAISDSQLAEAAFRGTEMTVQVSTKLNRSHAVVGDEALILPTMGRTEVDVQAAGPQFVSVEDTVCSVHGSHGQVPPVAPGLRSEVAIVCELARAVLGDRVPIAWEAMRDDYGVIRDHISHVVPGFDDYSRRAGSKEGFVLPNGPRDSRTFATETGKAMLTVNELEHVERPEGTLLLQTLRSHDQYNTTIYSLNDRYRGIKKGRHVVFVNPDDLAELGLEDGQHVDVTTVWHDDVERVLRDQRIVAYPSAKGCAAAYFPEANVVGAARQRREGEQHPGVEGRPGQADARGRLILPVWPAEEDWRRSVPALLTAAVERWGLRPGAVIEGGSVSHVRAVTTADGTPAVLKLSFPHREARDEAAALAWWDGHGAVRLLARVPDDPFVLLLERCEPGTRLGDRTDLGAAERLTIGADAAARLWAAGVPDDSPFERLVDVCDEWALLAEERMRTLAPPLDPGVVRQGVALLRDLPGPLRTRSSCTVTTTRATSSPPSGNRGS